LALGAAVAWVWRLDLAIPAVDRDRLWFGTVERGDLLREARGVGSLVPEEIRWVAARSSGHVERIALLPGSWVEPDTVVLELVNPELEQKTLEAKLAHRAAESGLKGFEIELQTEILDRKANLVQLESQQAEAEIAAEIDRELSSDGLVSYLQQRQSELRHEQLTTRVEIERQRLEFAVQNVDSQIDARRAQVEQARTRWELLRAQRDNLKVAARTTGALQRLSVEEGMQVQLGESLFQVANPENLKAVIRIPEGSARDLRIGLPARVDTRNRVVRGSVSRVDPNVENGSVAVDIRFEEALPKGARPDLTVEGVIELERLEDVVQLRRPAASRPNSEGRLFKLVAGAEEAARVPVAYGKASVSEIQILQGLKVGDVVVLSDMEEWSEYERVRIR